MNRLPPNDKGMLRLEKFYTIVSLGCPKNRVDTEKIMFVMTQAGYSYCDDPTDANVIIINTCAFIEPAVEESISTILDFKTDNPDAIMVVAGCLPLRYKADATEALPEVDLFLEPKNIRDLPVLLKDVMAHDGLAESDSHPEGISYAAMGRLLTTPGFGYLRVSDGCNRKCAYCSIPAIRGRMVSEGLDALETEALDLVSCGVRELILVAQDLCSYGIDLGLKNGLQRLLTRLTLIDQVSWIRLMYLHPNGLPKGLLELIRESEKILPYLDIPIQHISGRVLKDMNRPWDGKKIRNLVDMAREKVPGIVLRTTVMVGYPTETDEDFDELLGFMKSAQIDRVGVFEYSPEEGTPAFNLVDKVPAHVKDERRVQIEQVHSEFLEKKNRSRVGSIDDAIIEGYSTETELLLEGRLWDQAPEIDGKLFITDGNAPTGGIYKVKINEFNGPDFFGEIVV